MPTQPLFKAPSPPPPIIIGTSTSIEFKPFSCQRRFKLYDVLDSQHANVATPLDYLEWATGSGNGGNNGFGGVPATVGANKGVSCGT